MVSWILGEVDPYVAAEKVASADDSVGGGEVAMVFDTPPDDMKVPFRKAASNAMGMKAEKNKKRSDLALFREEANKNSVSVSERKRGADKGAKTGAEAAEAAQDPELSVETDLRGVALWRQWILEGKLKQAEDALHMHLRSHSIDTEAMSILADCRRKAGKYADALETYKNLIMIAGRKQANRARFKAGVLMQEQLGNHFGAASLFEEYLASSSGSPLLRAKATVRLARSLISLGEKARARKLLGQVMRTYGGTSAAIQAREILDGLN
jgi:TolA-binding protein